MSALQAFNETRAPAGSAAPLDQSGIASVVARLLDNAREAFDRDQDVARSCLAEAAALLDGRRSMPPAAEIAPARGGLAPWQARRVATHIDKHLASTIRMKDLTELTGLSTSYFSRAFKDSFGRSPYAYVIQRRMERAQEMMLASDEPLCQIALACGLSDQAHFSRLFRREIGLSPNMWRRQHRRAPDPELALAV
ncbi:helix-turn-helix domain-containing protein [Radicibacter daui]|uniref:helix-turn-helix domain-containing protein n=1 Tax=Radicibacter daui TaxID=3064829 RepID=UPI004046AA6C